MAEIQNGTAVLWGISADGNPVTISGYVLAVLESAKLTHKFKLDAVEDETGYDKALIASNEHMEVDVTFTPTENANPGFLTPFADVTLANFAVDDLNDTWIYVGDATIDLSHKQAKVMLKLRKYVNNSNL